MLSAIFRILHGAHAIVILFFEIFIGDLNGFDESLGSSLRHQHALRVFKLSCKFWVLSGIRLRKVLAQEFALDQLFDNLVIRDFVSPPTLVDFISQNFKGALANGLAIHRRNHFSSGDHLRGR